MSVPFPRGNKTSYVNMISSFSGGKDPAKLYLNTNPITSPIPQTREKKREARNETDPQAKPAPSVKKKKLVPVPTTPAKNIRKASCSPRDRAMHAHTDGKENDEGTPDVGARNELVPQQAKAILFK